MTELFIEFGDGSSLEVQAAADADLDSRFQATCLDTGESLWINGWLATTIEPLAAVEA
jgi:hypothetical protein